MKELCSRLEGQFLGNFTSHCLLAWIVITLNIFLNSFVTAAGFSFSGTSRGTFCTFFLGNCVGMQGSNLLVTFWPTLSRMTRSYGVIHQREVSKELIAKTFYSVKYKATCTGTRTWWSLINLAWEFYRWTGDWILTWLRLWETSQKLELPIVFSRDKLAQFLQRRLNTNIPKLPKKEVKFSSWFAVA